MAEVEAPGDSEMLDSRMARLVAECHSAMRALGNFVQAVDYFEDAAEDRSPDLRPHFPWSLLVGRSHPYAIFDGVKELTEYRKTIALIETVREQVQKRSYDDLIAARLGAIDGLASALRVVTWAQARRSRFSRVVAQLLADLETVLSYRMLAIEGHMGPDNRFSIRYSELIG